MERSERHLFATAALICTGMLLLFPPGYSPAQDAEAVARGVSAAEKEETGSTPSLDEKALARTVENAVAKRVRPLERELKAFKEEVRLHDIIGGIGYIVGVAGLAFYFLGVLRKERRKPEQGKD